MNKIDKFYLGDGLDFSFDGRDLELFFELDCVNNIVLTDRVLHHMLVMLAQAGFDFSKYVNKNNSECEPCKSKDLLIKDICEQWNEGCEEFCDSYAHADNCKAINIGNAKKALMEENKKLREALEKKSD